METSFLGCKGCEDYNTCKKPCPAIEAVLPKPQDGRLKGEFFGGDYLEEIIQREKDKISGKRIKPNIYSED